MFFGIKKGQDQEKWRIRQSPAPVSILTLWMLFGFAFSADTMERVLNAADLAKCFKPL
jgi:hypothetical protein